MPIVVRRVARRAVVIRIVPVAGPSRTPFLGARALLVISDLHNRSQPPASALAKIFGLTPAETRLASIMAAGISIERAVDQLGLSRATVRNQLKVVFAKTKIAKTERASGAALSCFLDALFIQATACAFRFLRQSSRPRPTRPVAKNGKAAGSGVVEVAGVNTA
jgi:DNA-binding CsgD family transcriptional regulator